jgi:hypothetical protein
MPSVEVGARQQDEAGTTSTEEGGKEREKVHDDEVCAMVGYVVKDLGAELYTELLQGLHK